MSSLPSGGGGDGECNGKSTNPLLPDLSEECGE